LLATTHNLDPRKRAVLKAVNKTAGMSDGGWTTLDRVREWLDDNDKPTPSESVLRSLLKNELREDWFIRVNEGAGTNGADLFRSRTDAGVQTPRTTDLDDYAERLDDVALDDEWVNVSNPFEDCVDPIRDQPFVETVEQFETEIAGGSATHDTSASSAMSGSTTDTQSSSDSSSADPLRRSDSHGRDSSNGDESSDDETQTTLDGATATTELPDPTGEPTGPVEQWLYERLRDTIGDEGRPFADHHSVAHYTDVVDTSVDDPLNGDIDDTVLDPSHELWDHDTFADDRIVDSADALRELSDAEIELDDKMILQFDHDENTPDGFYLVRCMEVEE
jgi:hypothetical protein